MIDNPSADPVGPSADQAVPVIHQLPTEGGSYTRDPATGELTPNLPEEGHAQ